MKNPKIVTDRFSAKQWFWWTMIPVIGIVAFVSAMIYSSVQIDTVFDTRGKTATATVTNPRNYHHWRSFLGYSMSVSFTNGKGESTEAYLYVTQGFTKQVQAGQSVPIIYDPEDPTRARIALDTYYMPHWRSILEGLVMVVILAGVFFGSLGLYVWYKAKNNRKSRT